jgi:hypothetical protein
MAIVTGNKNTIIVMSRIPMDDSTVTKDQVDVPVVATQAPEPDPVVEVIPEPVVIEPEPEVITEPEPEPVVVSTGATILPRPEPVIQPIIQQPEVRIPTPVVTVATPDLTIDNSKHHILVINGKQKKISKKSSYLLDMMILEE